jgi:hypothetical protein
VVETPYSVSSSITTDLAVMPSFLISSHKCPIGKSFLVDERFIQYVSEFQSYSQDAEVKVEKILREYQRGLTLRNQNMISEKDLQDYKTALDEAETSRNTVTRNQL